MQNPENFFSDQEICMHFDTGSDLFGGAIIPPIFGNSLFVYPTHEEFVKAENGSTKSLCIYTRD
ncbi:hypothetical protein SC499_21470 [Peribacillus simplex]|uniref:hypothetical protein n=1 Tax=Peribacillus simplex TaxID=1478 RepID=UPI00298E80D0|nr:hypothetical protein [Peribacillus simplex]MDW7617180.1 hypothetical protein [Peribacillus simplex]